jgi:hypothetical protein
MTFEGALIREQGVSFAVVVVKPQVFTTSTAAEDLIRAFTPAFDGVPVVLMAQDGRGRPTYYGRKDIARFMAGVPLRRVRWKRFTID